MKPDVPNGRPPSGSPTWTAVLFKLAVLALLGGRGLFNYCAPSLLAAAGGVAAGLVQLA